MERENISEEEQGEEELEGTESGKAGQARERTRQAADTGEENKQDYIEKRKFERH